MTLTEQLDAMILLADIADALEEVQNANISEKSLKTINGCLVFLGDETAQKLKNAIEG